MVRPAKADPNEVATSTSPLDIVLRIVLVERWAERIRLLMTRLPGCVR